MRVQDLMTQDVKTCGPDDPLSTPAGLMNAHDCGSVPVVGSDGRIIGMLTDRDICMAALRHAVPLEGIRVAEAMARQVCSVRPDDTLETAAGMMRRHQVRRLPVVDPAGRVVGLLSLGDLARRTDPGAVDDRAGEVAARELAATLGAVSQPRRIRRDGTEAA